MAIDADRARLRRRVWAPALTVAALIALAFGLLRAHGASGDVPTPILSTVRLPSDPTTTRSASFMFTAAQAVTFECSLDALEYEACGHGVFGAEEYSGPLALGSHGFRVRTRVGASVSAPASYGWTIVASSSPGTDPSDPNGGPSAGDESETAGGATFRISGSVSGLAPGVTKTIVLTLRNPSLSTIEVTRVTVAVDESKDPPGCSSERNLVLHQAVGISASTPVGVPARGRAVVRAPRAPRITFVNRPWNQDACKGQTFALEFSGSGRS